MQKRYLKLLSLVIALSIVLSILACQAGKNDEYPQMRKMERNLAKKNYSISVIQSLNSMGGGEFLLGEKDDDFIESYWLKDKSSITSVVDTLKARYATDAVFVIDGSVEDPVSIVYVGSLKAIADAGIKRIVTH